MRQLALRKPRRKLDLCTVGDKNSRTLSFAVTTDMHSTLYTLELIALTNIV